MSGAASGRSAGPLRLFDLRGKVAIVTGSSRGIGRSIAENLAEAGARVVISSRKGPACEEVAESIRRAGGEAAAIPATISDKAQLEQLVERARSTFGPIDILVCNAASNPYFGPSTGMSDEVYEKVMRNNVLSNHWLAQLVRPDMAARRDGSIIIVSSIGGLKGSPVIGAYCISKSADMQLARNLAVEYGEAGVRVNTIAPGLIKTDFAKALWDNPDILKRSTAGSALKRIGEPDEIAGMAVFLASKAGAFTTGQTFVIDGGATIM